MLVVVGNFSFTNNMKPNRLIFIALLFSTKLLIAQADFRPGYVVPLWGDTLFGQVDYRGDLMMGSICRFKTADNAVQEFKPADINGYRFKDSKYFVSKEVNGKMVFLEYLIKGKVNVYYKRDDKGDHYYIDKENMKLIELPYEKGIKLVDGKQVYYETTKHYGILGYYMQEAQGIQSQIQSIQEPEHKNLTKLAEDYHNMVCKDEKCIIYGKKRTPVEILVELNGGIGKFALDNVLMNELGGLVYLSIPRTNENVFFKTGFAHDFASEDGYSIKIYKIPLQLHYIYRARRIQPKIGGGFNLAYIEYSKMEYSNVLYGHFCFVSLNAGIDYKITNKLALTSTFNTDNMPAEAIFVKGYDFNIFYSINVGLRIKLK
jgi:hypothetical protein